MTNDQTLVIPRQPAEDPPQDERPTDGWDSDAPVVGSAPVGGPVNSSRERALGTLAWVLPTVAMAALTVARANWPGLRVPELTSG